MQRRNTFINRRIQREQRGRKKIKRKGEPGKKKKKQKTEGRKNRGKQGARKNRVKQEGRKHRELNPALSSSQNSSRIGKPKIEKQRRHQKPGNIGYSLSYGHPLRSFTSKIVSRQGKSSSPCLFPFKSSSPLSTVRRKLITFGLYHARFNKFTRASPRRVPGMGK